MPPRTDPPSAGRWVTLSLAAIVAAGAIVRFWGLDFGLPHTEARPDETIVIDVALKLASGNVRPVFYDYPWLYMWTSAALYLLYYVWGLATGTFQTVADMVASWPQYWNPFFLINRALSATCGTLTILVVFRIARRLWGNATGLVAALFMSLVFLHVRDSHYGTTDTMMTFLLMVSMSFLVEAHLTGRGRTFAAAGLFGGLAAATKYNALLVVVPAAMSHAVAFLDSRDWRRAMLDKRLVVFGLPFLAALAIGVPFLFYDLERFRQQMALLGASMRGFGHVPLGSGWSHHFQYSLRYGMGLPLLTAGLAGTVALLIREPRVGAVLIAFPVTYYITAGSVRIMFFRYAIPLLPFLCLAAARLVTWAVPKALSAGAARLGRPHIASMRAQAAAVAAVAIALVLPTAASTIAFDRILGRTDNRVLIAQWFDDNVPAGDSLLMSGSPYGYAQFTRDRFDVWMWDRRRHIFVVGRERRPAEGRPDWILVQESPLPSATQPVVLNLLKEGYAFVRVFRAFSPHAWSLYDPQDAFFVPYAGFGGVERPGPNYALYKRMSVP